VLRSKWLIGLILLIAGSSSWASGSKQSVDQILDRYSFVADFNQKEETRDISREIFWHYPFVLPKVEFPIHASLDDAKIEMPATKGDGRAIDHLNRGRLLFLEGNIKEAKATWLSGRARYGNKYPFHRRNDYFVGLSFLNIADQLMSTGHLDYEAPDVRKSMSNAGTFFSWAFIVKADQPDALVEAVTPKGLYNLAAIYWRYNRFDGAFGAATTGLNYLRKTGRTDLRSEFHRLIAESFIKNRSYLEAVQELDTAIRQDRLPEKAAIAFARVGDIYYDLNNYELAEDAYGLAASLDVHLQQINPSQLVLRAESLFWLGRFSEAQKMLHFAIHGTDNQNKVNEPLTAEYLSWASLRLADAYLAQNKIEEAKLEYFKVAHDFKSSLPGRLALVREACLELPFYQGNNVKHARELLEQAKLGGDMPGQMKELAWACQVGSYTQRDRTAGMLQRVAQFSDAYPSSDFLKSFAEPVRAYQATHIEKYFKDGDIYRALSFFEKNRKTLFPKVTPDLAKRLFVAYADINRAKSAAEFWDAYAKTADSDLKRLRLAVVTAEMLSQSKAKIWKDRDHHNQAELKNRKWTIKSDDLVDSYVTRMRQITSDPGHLIWLLNLARHFGEKNSDYACDVEYPLLSRLNAAGPLYAEIVQKGADRLINKFMPDLFQTDESCAQSLLDLEAEHLKKMKPKVIADRYLQRQSWPLNGAYLHQYWTVSEYVYDAGATEEARKLWEAIRDKGGPSAPEVAFAKARLDPARTEFENLWN